MRTREGRTLQSLRAVQAFLIEHAGRLDNIASSGARQKLDTLLEYLLSHAATQSGSDLAARGATQKYHALRQALLRDHMAPIARVAAADLADVPDIAALRLPRGKLSIERLHAAAVGMAEMAALHAGVFIAAGLPPDFAARLTMAADAMITAVTTRKTNRVARAGATKGISAELNAARRIVHVLDAMITSACHEDPSLLRAWTMAHRVERLPGRRPADSVNSVPDSGSSASVAETENPQAAASISLLSSA